MKITAARALFKRMDKDNSGYLEENEVPDCMIETYKVAGLFNY